jgi:spermidine/putrescine transport system ATP-binding protein
MSAQPATVATGALAVTGVCKRFGPREVLRAASFAAAHGEFVTLLGPSGCGKTTLLRIIAGFEVADAGQVLLGGLDLTRLPANRRPVNTVFQHFALFPHLSVADNIAFGLRARRFPAAEVAQRVAAAAAMLELAPLLARRPARLSGGEQQRVALARALVNQPLLLVLDEPMSALDARLRVAVQAELRALQRRLGTTFLLVTHDQDEAMAVSDRILVMDGGRIAQDGPPAEVYDRPRTRFVAEFLGAANLIPARRRGDGAVDTPLGILALPAAPPWEAGTLAIRPERVRVTPGGRDDRVSGSSLSAVVAQTVFRGDHLELLLRAGPDGRPLRAHASPGSGLGEGALVAIELRAEDLRVLDD